MLSGRRWWLHVGGASLAVFPACLVNPYGWHGAIFPLELFPKITAWGGPYKSYVDEFMDLRAFVQTLGLETASGDFFFRVECFLLWMLPLSFIMPGTWAACRPAAPEKAWIPRRALPWLLAFALAVGLVGASTFGFSEAGTLRSAAQFGRLAPWGILAVGLTGAVSLLATRSSAAAALLAASGAAAETAWILWLRGHLSGTEPGLFVGAIALVLGFTAAAIILRTPHRGRLFRIILSVAFSYLALTAVRNINLFALVAGFVLSWNLDEWAFELASSRPEVAPMQRSIVPAGLIARGGLAILVGLWIAAIASGWFFRATGEARRFGLGESPLAYAHEAAKFAGRPGMPQRALALDLRQAGVYLFHNGPERKLFIDGRLEVPSRATFETFVRLGPLLREGRPGWPEALHRLGDPLVLLDHAEDFGAEATLLAQPGWRLRFLRSRRVRVHRGSPGCTRGRVPSSRFRRPPLSRPGLACDTPRTLRDGRGRGTHQAGLDPWPQARPRSRWNLRFSLMLLASDRLRQGLASGFGLDTGPAATAGLWNLLGHCSWNMVPDLKVAPAGPDEPWDPARSLFMAQATFSYRQSLEIDPQGASALASLHDSFKARRMADAQSATIAAIRRLKRLPDSSDSNDESRAAATDDAEPSWTSQNEPDFMRAVDSLIAKGQPETAVRLFADGVRNGIEPSWLLTDKVAATLLHLGRPIEARKLWEQADSPPSQAQQLTRIATSAVAAFNFETAIRVYGLALDLDPSLPEAWFGLALSHTQQGNAGAALAAARAGLKAHAHARPEGPARRHRGSRPRQ